MKQSNKLLLVLAGILLIMNLGCARAPLQFRSGSEPNGFKDIEWGTNISTLKGMVFIKTGAHPEDKIYIRKSDIFRMEGVRLDEIYYYFWKDRFYAVDIYTRGYKNFNNLKRLVFSKFSEGQTPDLQKEYFNYSWAGGKTEMDLTYLKSNQLGTQRIESKEISMLAGEQTQEYLAGKKK